MAQNSSSTDTPSLSGLLSPGPASLSDWYGDPLARTVAGALLAQLRTRQQSRLRAGIPCFQLQVLAIICHGWLGSEPEFGYEQLVALAASDHDCALLELAQGQLLASRKCLAAMGHLQQGFRLAAPLLASDRYFELVRRHELLGYLPFSEKPSAPQNLVSLLKEAAVINRLRTGERHQHAAGHLDTVG